MYPDRDSSLSLCVWFLICLSPGLFSMSSYFDFDLHLIMCLEVSCGMSFLGILPRHRINFSEPKCAILVPLRKLLLQNEIRVC